MLIWLKNLISTKAECANIILKFVWKRRRKWKEQDWLEPVKKVLK